MSLLQIIVLLVGSGGSISALITGIVLWRKSGAEKERITVGAAGDVVIMQGNVMRFLHEEVARLTAENGRLRERIKEMDERRQQEKEAENGTT